MSKITERRNTIYTNRTGNENIDEIKQSHSKEMVEKFLSKEYFAESLWAELHEEWRKDYASKAENIDADGRVKPRIKTTTDKKWIEAHGGMEEVDIYYTPFKDLPVDRQWDNLKAGQVVVDLVYDKVMNWEEITDEMIEEWSSIVHEKWMERNSWDKENRPHLFVPYWELPPDEQKKDRDQVKHAIDRIRSGK